MDADPSDDILLDRHEFVVSYNPKRNGPNWVSWRLDRSQLGDVHRDNHFHADALLPSPYYRVEPHDYAHSGYDRGHLCPSGDRTRSESANSATFTMTNMLPQVHELNAGAWEKLEEFERQVVVQERTTALQIIAGGIFADPTPTIAHSIAVPQSFYKIIVRLGSQDRAADLTPQTPVVVVIMPNNAATTQQRSWHDFSTSLDDVERQTGYRFLTALRPEVRLALRSRIETGQ